MKLAGEFSFSEALYSEVLYLKVLSMLGSVSGKYVVELGAGIGRFTGALAATAKHVLAVDFMENLIAENRKVHGHRSAC